MFHQTTRTGGVRGRAVVAGAAAILGLGAACTASRPDGPRTPGGSASSAAGSAGDAPGLSGAPVPPERAVRGPSVAVTSQRVSGNRVADGVVDLTGEPVVLGRSETIPVWLVGAPLGAGASLWVAVDEQGRVRAWRLTDGAATSVAPPGPSRVAPGSPPVLRLGADGWALAHPPTDLAPGAAPTSLGDGSLLYVDVAGALRVAGHDAPVDRGLLPDGRPTVAPDGRVAVLAAPTDAYAHAVLGDGVEAREVRVYPAGPSGPAQRTLRLGPDEVIEGREAAWVDLDDDGRIDDLLVTVSDPEVGARPTVFLDGRRRVDGPAVGAGSRWRHAIGVVPPPSRRPGASAADRREVPPRLVEVVTPHLAQIATVSLLAGGAIRPVATRPDAAASHLIGDRNLDRALLVDVDGDGAHDLVSQDGDRLVAYDLDGLDLVGEVTLGTAATTNLAAVAVGGAAWLGVGLADGRVVVVGG